MEFIKEIAQSEWAHLKELQTKLAIYQADLTAVDNKVVKILNNLIDAYYICLGQLEALPEKQTEATIVQPEKEIVVIPEVKTEPVIGTSINVAAVSPEVKKTAAVDPIEPRVEISLEATRTDSDLVDKPINIASGISDDDMWNCEFGDPVGPKLTDADLYEN